MEFTKIKTKKSVTTVTGYACQDCSIENVVYGDGQPVPTTCLGCDSQKPQKRVWQDVVETQVTTKTVLLK